MRFFHYLNSLSVSRLCLCMYVCFVCVGCVRRLLVLCASGWGLGDAALADLRAAKACVRTLTPDAGPRGKGRGTPSV